MNSFTWLVIVLWGSLLVVFIRDEHAKVAGESWLEIFRYYRAKRSQPAMVGDIANYNMWSAAERMYMESRGETHVLEIHIVLDPNPNA